MADRGARTTTASAGLPLSALLSQLLVALTIEVDNEFEHRMRHRTSNHGASPGRGRGPWLTSFAMWGNFLRFVGPDGITVDELTARPGVETWALPGMMRWGYVTVEGGTGAWRGKQPPRDATVHLRSSGRRAAAIWSGLSEPLQRRWRKRFGSEQIDALRDALARLAGHAERELPHYLIDGRYEMRVELARAGDTDGGRTAQRAAAAELDLVALLSQTLLLYAADYDARASRGIALGANALRVMSADPVRLRDLAPRVGLARETTDVIVGRMAKWGLAAIDGERTASRGKVARLTDEGLRARAEYLPTAEAVEFEWSARYGELVLERLRTALIAVVGESEDGRSRLWAGLEPYPDGWRASVAAPECLPHYPLVTHRGGYPDGS